MRPSIFLFVLFLCSCSVTGKIEHVEADKSASAPKIDFRIGNVSASSGANAADNQAVRVFNWGEFNEEEMNILSTSIANSLASYDGASAVENYDVHVRFHRYSQTITNASYASLVVVDWALVKGDSIIVDQVFFAGHDSVLNIFTGKTLGRAKDTTNRAIIHRIVNKTVSVLSDGAINPSLDESIVYDRAEQLIAVLPKEMTSTGMVSVEPGVAVVMMSGRSAETNFHNRASFTKVDWKYELSGF